MTRAEITMKSGAVVTFDTMELEWKRANIPGGARSLKWTTPDSYTRALMHVDLDEVAAIVIVEDPS